MTADVMLPEAQPDKVLPIDWLQPHFIDQQGQLISSIFSLLVESQGKRLVIDTCLGNDKPRMVPSWNERQGSFLEELAVEFFGVAAVVCDDDYAEGLGWGGADENRQQQGQQY